MKRHVKTFELFEQSSDPNTVSNEWDQISLEDFFGLMCLLGEATVWSEDHRPIASTFQPEHEYGITENRLAGRLRGFEIELFWFPSYSGPFPHDISVELGDMIEVSTLPAPHTPTGDPNEAGTHLIRFGNKEYTFFPENWGLWKLEGFSVPVDSIDSKSMAENPYIRKVLIGLVDNYVSRGKDRERVIDLLKFLGGDLSWYPNVGQLKRTVKSNNLFGV